MSWRFEGYKGSVAERRMATRDPNPEAQPPPCLVSLTLTQLLILVFSSLFSRIVRRRLGVPKIARSAHHVGHEQCLQEEEGERPGA